MPAKSSSPEAAQKKVWKAEIRDLRKAASKVIKDFNAEERRLQSEDRKAFAAAKAASAKLAKFVSARDKKQTTAVASVMSRIAILEGRLGL